MKTTVRSLLFALTLILVGCNHAPIEEEQGFVIQQTTTENISAQGTTVSIEIKSKESSWSLSSNQPWCVPESTTGSGNATVVLRVAANLEPKVRTAIVTLLSAFGAEKKITLTQQPSDGTEHHYRLPVIFHVLCADPSDPNQDVRPGYLAEVIERVNQRFRSKIDLNVELVMAPTDPKGKPLQEPGVERIRHSGTYPIDCNRVMNTTRNEFFPILWDPNQYINILIYPFLPNSTTLGIAQFPLTPPRHRLVGTNESPVSTLTLADIAYTYCVSLNRDYLYERSTESELNMADFVATTTHELGHYLGLHHTFTENDEGVVDDCFDSDYCADTPSYNRVAYERWLGHYFNTTAQPKISEVVQRTSCSGQPFVSTNVMDYYTSWNNEFTADQRARVRHVLTYSPLIPGPKINTDQTTIRRGITPKIIFRSVE